jgi:isochorismate synthase
MQIKGREYDLYAGGGLLRESTADSEWEETEAKLATMRNVLKG